MSDQPDQQPDQPSIEQVDTEQQGLPPVPVPLILTVTTDLHGQSQCLYTIPADQVVGILRGIADDIERQTK